MSHFNYLGNHIGCNGNYDIDAVSYTHLDVYKRQVSILYNSTSVILDLNGGIPINKEVRQGCYVSPTLFNIYIDDMLRAWKSRVTSGITAYKSICMGSLLYACLLYTSRCV